MFFLGLTSNFVPVISVTSTSSDIKCRIDCPLLPQFVSFYVRSDRNEKQDLLFHEKHQQNFHFLNTKMKIMPSFQFSKIYESTFPKYVVSGQILILGLKISLPLILEKANFFSVLCTVVAV